MKDKWYPPIKQPPKEVEDYLVTFSGGRMGICQWTNIFWVGHAVEGEWHWNFGDVPQYQRVIAWRPAPTPYTEDEMPVDEITDYEARIEKSINDFRYAVDCLPEDKHIAAIQRLVEFGGQNGG